MAHSVVNVVSFALLLVAAAPRLARSFPQGPPVEQHFDNVCNLMTPLHHGNRATPGNGGFSIITNIPRVGYEGFNYTAGTTYTVNLNGSAMTFRGFLVIAHVPGEDHMLLGSFIPQNKSQQTLDCSLTNASNERESTIAHNNSDLVDFHSIILKWRAPAAGQHGMVDFRFTVVHKFSKFYTYQRASLNGLSPPTKVPEKYRLTFRDPPDCHTPLCDVFVGIDTNAGDPDFLDIYLEGMANGWVAVGFTETANMFSSVVVACNRNPVTDIVQALDTYNTPPMERDNRVDPSQNIVQFSANYSDGKIICSVAKKIVPDVPPPIDVNLDSALFILFGRKKGDSGTESLTKHEEDPKISAEQFNPVRDSATGDGGNFPMVPLIRAHGSLMLIAWPLLGVCGIFFVSWMRPALPKGQWFWVHLTFMLSSLFVGVVGVAMVFIAHAHEDNPRGLIELGSNNPVGTAHFSIGLLIIVLQITNPIVAVFRCNPKHERRWIFNVLHGVLIGFDAQLLAFINVGLGTCIFADGPSNIFWVYVSYAVCILIIFSLLYFIFTASAIVNHNTGLAPSLLKPLFKLVFPSHYSAVSTSESIKMSYSAIDGNDMKSPIVSTDTMSTAKDKKTAQRSKDSVIRWTTLIVYLVVTTPLIVAMVTMAATSPISG